MSDNDLNSEEALQAHIRHLLTDYALTHLTTDYVEFTENLVGELLGQALKLVPTSDPNALYRPLDPLQKLARIYRLDFNAKGGHANVNGDLGTGWLWKQTKLEVGREGIAYIKGCVGAPPPGTVLRSERAVFDEGLSYEPFRPMTPVLTLKAIKETPHPGRGEYRRVFGPKKSTLELVEVEEDPVLDQNSVLNVKWTRKKDEEDEYRKFVSSTAILCNPNPNRVPPYRRFLDRVDSPAPPPPITTINPFSDVGFVPIFSRRERQEKKRTLDGLEDLVELLPEVEVSSDGEEIHKQNMAIVNGWRAYISSPISSLSPPSSQERDELVEFRISSPNTEPLSAVGVLESKMDVPIMPRAKRIHGAEGPAPRVGNGQKLDAFLAPFVHQIASGTMVEDKPQNELASSVLGQPPTSILESMVDGEGYRLHDDDQWNKEIRAVYQDGGVGGADVLGFVMKEKLDISRMEEGEKGEGGRSEGGGGGRVSANGIGVVGVIEFMDVPNLEEPNVHPEGVHTSPKGLKDYFETGLVLRVLDGVPVSKVLDGAPVSNVLDNAKLREVGRFLKKVKGIQALNVSLPWTPYIARFRIPTQLEIARVDHLFSVEDPEDQTIQGYSAKDRAGVEELLGWVCGVPKGVGVGGGVGGKEVDAYIDWSAESRLKEKEEGEEDVGSISNPWDDVVVLTRAEREAKYGRMKRRGRGNVNLSGGGGVEDKSEGKRVRDGEEGERGGRVIDDVDGDRGGRKIDGGGGGGGGGVGGQSEDVKKKRRVVSSFFESGVGGLPVKKKFRVEVARDGDGDGGVEDSGVWLPDDEENEEMGVGVSVGEGVGGSRRKASQNHMEKSFCESMAVVEVIEDSCVWFPGEDEGDEMETGGMVEGEDRSTEKSANHGHLVDRGGEFSLPPSSLSIHVDDDDGDKKTTTGPAAGDRDDMDGDDDRYDDDDNFADFDYADFDFGFKVDHGFGLGGDRGQVGRNQAIHGTIGPNLATHGAIGPNQANHGTIGPNPTTWDESSDLWYSTSSSGPVLAPDMVLDPSTGASADDAAAMWKPTTHTARTFNPTSNSTHTFKSTGIVPFTTGVAHTTHATPSAALSLSPRSSTYIETLSGSLDAAAKSRVVTRAGLRVDDLPRTPERTFPVIPNLPNPSVIPNPPFGQGTALQQSSSPASLDLNNPFTGLSTFAKLRFLEFAPSTYDVIEAKRKRKRDEDKRKQDELEEKMNNRPKGPPDDLVDEKTMGIPPVDYFGGKEGGSSEYKYMASLDVIQLRGVVGVFKSHPFNTSLVERYSLGTTTGREDGHQNGRTTSTMDCLPGVDLILDPHTAVILVSLFTLPAKGGQLVKRISEASWRFSEILIVFQAFPEGQARSIPIDSTTVSAASSSSTWRRKMEGHRMVDAPYAYTPPIIKAVKKLKRDLDIAEGMGTMRGGDGGGSGSGDMDSGSGMGTSRVRWVFAANVEEVVCACRQFADEAEGRALGASTPSISVPGEVGETSFETAAAWVWGSRDWLDGDVSEDEHELASIPGMNHFSASIVLSIVTLQEFLDLSCDERVDAFGSYIGDVAVVRFNEWLEKRTKAMEEAGEGMEVESSNWD
ncbi:hypothetical protein BDN72DRAFT_957663 [Pluteus cervinus]|uniref:Uncharacterized protein n=1 Tax=Pluteus cervinus TaxID=181527 RepID=A0ACD3B276_9AGAR|nr:hypothetical protein BDN72DRAFT_957663 [Pluteus cervinus]